ncbi:hypothetical protein [Ottowia sp.]|uniref:hypothetical protein n=1 Tax=Ottowia sp. TaxID=1898956 RepID=UPI002C8E032B|nr:hypothetical protein [Ottowia sp.]HRN75156.1 hypothetical protein [Ottowia sp.]
MKKGRVNDATRPQPTIYGNCDSWDFIVGKKRLDPSLATELPCRRDAAANVLSTGYQQIQKDNTGKAVGALWTSSGLRGRIPPCGPNAHSYYRQPPQKTANSIQTRM